MAIRNIIQNGDNGLKKVSKPVTKFDARLAQLLDDLADTLVEANGLGLAAPQVGVLRRVFVALDEPPVHAEAEEEGEGCEDGEDEEEEEIIVREFVNPEIIQMEGEQYGYEGCLSFPGEYGAVKRPNRVVIRAQNRHGETFTMEGEGLMARCFCHETNHLDGVTFDTLADFFFDPENPRDLDAELMDDEGEEENEA